MSKAEML